MVLEVDFPNAYLNTDMTEKVHVHQPYGMANCLEEENRVGYIRLRTEVQYVAKSCMTT